MVPIIQHQMPRTESVASGVNSPQPRGFMNVPAEDGVYDSNRLIHNLFAA